MPMYAPQLLEPGRHIGILMGTASEDYVRKINTQLLNKADRRPSTLDIRDALTLLGCVLPHTPYYSTPCIPRLCVVTMHPHSSNS